MSNSDVFRIGMAIHHIVSLVDDDVLKEIKPYVETIENIVKNAVEEVRGEK